MGSNYGIMTRIEKNIMNKISVAYHKAIKKILNMNVWDSNHLACEILGAWISKLRRTDFPPFLGGQKKAKIISL